MTQAFDLNNVPDEKDRNILASLMEGNSVIRVAAFYGCTPSTVYKKMDIYKFPFESFKEKYSKKPLSDFHVKVGEKLIFERTVIAKEKLKDASKGSNITSHRLKALEDGTEDITLSDLMKLSRHYNTQPYLLLKVDG